MKKMMQLGSWATCLGFLLALSSCGGGDRGKGGQPVKTARLGGLEYGFIEEGSLQPTESKLEGTGRVIFREPLTRSDNNYALGFTLTDGGSLTLVAAASTALANGAEVKFSRVGSTLKVELTRERVWDLSADFTTVNAAAPLSFKVDVHAHGHVIVWVGEAEEEVGEYAFTPQLSQKFWGLALNGASLTSLKLADAKEHH